MMQETMAIPADIGNAPSTKSAAAATREKSGSMVKILVLVGIAIVIFMAVSAFSVRTAIQGSSQLTAIEQLYFPVLQRLDANIVRVDKMQEAYIQVVVTGDPDMIDKAGDIAANTNQTFAEIAKLYTASRPVVTRLQADLHRYQDLATQVSHAFLAHSSADMQPMTAEMNASFRALRQDLTDFRQASYEEFTQTLAKTKHDANVDLGLGLALGVMNIAFMAVLVFFIRNNMKMMAIIAVQNATLENRVAERTAQLSQKTSDINAMLQNMKLGVSTVVPGNRIHPEYSNYLRTIFASDDLAGKDLSEALFSASSLGVDAKDQVTVALGAILGEDAMMFDFNSHLLAREMTINPDGRQKIVQMDWSPILGENGTVDKVLLITQDVTQLRELEASSASQRDELEIISKLIRTPVGKFNAFIESSLGYIAENRRLLSGASGNDPATIAALFRNMHTIKGNARTFEFTHITNTAHSAEQTYDMLRKDPSAAWDVHLLHSELDAVDAAVLRYGKVNDDTLGRKGRAADLLTNRGSFISTEQLASLRTMALSIERNAAPEKLTEFNRAIGRLGLVPLSRIVSGAADAVESLATEIGKPAPSIEVIDDDSCFNPQFAETLKSCLMHLLRNSLDHGIEAPADRVRADKAERGTIRFTSQRHGDQLQLRIGDDGRGLALHRLFDKAVAEGVFAATQKPARGAVAELIFRSGLSTAAQVTQVSGRGVGMDAVRTFLAERGATIQIELERPADPDLGFARFEFLLVIPSAALEHGIGQ